MILNLDKNETKFCKHCGKQILKEAVVCINCGLQVEELNNPVNDSTKAATLFYDEVNAFQELSPGNERQLCRRRRGPLHLPMGLRLPPGLPADRPTS